MTLSSIANLRLANQQLIQPRFTYPKDLVSWLGAVQAQDYAGSLWAIGLRIPGSNESMIETAIKNKEIVRTWPMRGTWHLVAAEDARWMLQLLTPRVFARAAGIHKLAGLDDAVFKKSKKVIIKALEDNQQLTRKELYERLEKAKIATDGQRGLHILGYWAQQSLICLGPHKGKQPCFVLLNEWLPQSKELKKEEALAALAERYFKSHGPATIHDFAWWSGLTITEAKRGLESIKENLQSETFDKQEYWMSKNASFEKTAPCLQLLPPFDEYLVAYKDRSAAFDEQHLPQIVKSGNGIFSPVIIINGRVAGTWKRSFVRDEVEITMEAFAHFTNAQTAALKRQVKQYEDFLGKKVSVVAASANVNLS